MKRFGMISAVTAIAIVGVTALVLTLCFDTMDTCCDQPDDLQPAGSSQEGEEKLKFNLETRYAPKSLEEVAAERLAYIDRHGSFAGLGRNPSAPRPTVGRWNSIGPYGMIQTTDQFYEFSGLILSIAQHYDDSKVLYIGAANGGVWKSVDAGTSWFSVFDSLPVPTVGTVAVSALRSDNTVWIGTGATLSRDCRIPIGLVYKSTNGGTTWTRVTSFPGSHGLISKIILDFFRPNIVYVGTDIGFYRSTDGGTSWSQRLAADVSDIVVNSDLFDPNSAVVNVAVQRRTGAFPQGGLRRSTDGGVSFASSFVPFPGLPIGFTGRMTLTNGVSHTTIYSAVSNGGNGLGGIWQSTDRGATWTLKTNPFGGGGGQGFRNNAIAVDPVDAQRILIGWNFRNIFVSTDGGTTWGIGSPVHEDIQQIMFDRNDRRNVYHVSDAGVFKSTDQGVKWDDAGGRYLPLAEIYHVTPSLTDPQREWIGTQDNGISEGHNSFLAWEHRTCCDGGDILLYQDNVYVNLTGLSNSSPNRWQMRKVSAGNDTWVAFTQGLPNGSPGLFPPSQIEFNGTNFYTRLWDTIYVAQGTSLPWRPLAGSPRTDNQRIPWFYAAPNGYVFVGYESVVSPIIRMYNPVANAWFSPSGGSGGLPALRGVTGFSAYQVGSSNVVFASLTGTTGDRIFKSSNNGQTWISVTNDLPSLVNLTCVLVDKFNTNVLYVGSDFGVFGSNNGGQNWVNLSDGLPSVPVVSALSQRFNGEILAATFGRGVFAAPRGVPSSAGADVELPKEFALDQNYPNPFNPLTSIGFSLPEGAHVNLVVFDVSGRAVETLQDGILDAGRHIVRWNAARYASGVYYYRLEAGTYRETKKMMLVK